MFFIECHRPRASEGTQRPAEKAERTDTALVPFRPRPTKGVPQMIPNAENKFSEITPEIYGLADQRIKQGYIPP